MINSKNLNAKSILTVRELKEFVKDLPEVNKWGEEFEVWITNQDDECLSYPAGDIHSLNFREGYGQDICINPYHPKKE